MKRITVKVVPRASSDEVVGMQGDLLKVKLRAPPVDGAANESLRKVLAEHFSVKPGQVRIVRGEKARTKVVEVGEETRTAQEDVSRIPRSIPVVTVIVTLLLLAGCGPQGASRPKRTLAEARTGFTTHLVRQESEKEPVEAPPAGMYRVVSYPSPAGKMAAYLSEPPGSGGKSPAIIWIVGGFSNSIGATSWEEASPDNDQSARAFHQAGIITMYPSFRGGNENPGFKEGFYGEVDDVLAAADFLAKQEFVDPQRIYLGGHSTGGTLALLAAEMGRPFRAVFSFGPTDDVTEYGKEVLPFDMSRRREGDLRAPRYWLHGIRSPVFVFEGTDPPSNVGSLEALEEASQNPLVRFHAIPGGTHFTILEPMTRLVAAKILADRGVASNMEFTEAELNGVVGK